MSLASAIMKGQYGIRLHRTIGTVSGHLFQRPDVEASSVTPVASPAVLRQAKP